MKSFQVGVDNRKFNFDSDLTSLMFFGSSFYMKMVLNNLLKNAVKYGKNNIKVSVRSDTNKVFLMVEDDGVGIATELQKSVFIPFSRIDQSRNKDTGGFGLGLAIVDSIIKKHGGDIDITKSELGGAMFTICLFIP